MLPLDPTPSCPECAAGPTAGPVLRRRDFFRVVGASAAVVAAGGLTPLQTARAARAARQAEAEGLVFELFKSMSDDQKKKLVRPWDFGAQSGNGIPARLTTHNAAVGKSVIGEEYDKKQVEILHRVFKAIGNGDEGYRRLSRGGTFDGSKSFEGMGALTYGEPAEGKKFSLVFTGHHLTLRCDGNSEESAAFGGPLYYGHSPSGYAAGNVFNYQTKAVHEVFESLNEKQRAFALKDGTWKDGESSVKPPRKGAKLPGVGVGEMTRDQKGLIETVMRALVAPYRKEDGDEVMEIVKANGGLDRIALAFYRDAETTEKQPWSYWRLEGPGFVWSFRALPHIHTFVNVRAAAA